MAVETRTLTKLLDLDFPRVSRSIEKFISNYVLKSSAKGLLIGLSGGLDSAVVFKLAVNALSPSGLLGIVMPSDVTPANDTHHAIELAESHGVKYHIIDINPLLEKYAEKLPKHKTARGNLMARIRMSILYYYSNINDYLVAGTSDKSEYEIGYFSKFGDGAADILPIADLYKTQVRALGRFLGIPATIVEKKSSPRLWINHLAEKELGMNYEAIDPILYLLVDKKMKPNDVARKLKIPSGQVNKIRDLMKRNSHKRTPVPIAPLKR